MQEASERFLVREELAELLRRELEKPREILGSAQRASEAAASAAGDLTAAAGSAARSFVLRVLGGARELETRGGVGGARAACGPSTLNPNRAKPSVGDVTFAGRTEFRLMRLIAVDASPPRAPPKRPPDMLASRLRSPAVGANARFDVPCPV